VDTLRAELQAVLGLEKEKVVVNRLTGHIIVKVGEARALLELERLLS